MGRHYALGDKGCHLNMDSDALLSPSPTSKSAPWRAGNVYLLLADGQSSHLSLRPRFSVTGRPNLPNSRSGVRVASVPPTCWPTAHCILQPNVPTASCNPAERHIGWVAHQRASVATLPRVSKLNIHRLYQPASSATGFEGPRRRSTTGTVTCQVSNTTAVFITLIFRGAAVTGHARLRLASLPSRDLRKPERAAH